MSTPQPQPRLPPARPAALAPASRLPAWPVHAGLVAFPLWWLVGLVDVTWVLLAAVMLMYLCRTRAITAPRGYGIWLLYLILVICSAIGLRTGGEAIGWTYRLLQYLSVAVVVLYVVNARSRLPLRAVAGGLTCLWLTTVAGGYLGMLLPTAQYHSPMSYLLPDALLANDLVNQMVVRGFSQYDPGGYFQDDPRPSAPYLYTNNWGNVYSLLFPFVVAYLLEVRGTRRFWWLVAALPVSLVPAFMTLNRGMFLGLGIALAYTVARQALRANVKVLLGLGVVAVTAAVVYAALPVAERLDQRLEDSPTTESRSAIYEESLDAVKERPLFGYGAPLDPLTPNGPPVGTHGQFWTVLVLHGPAAVLCFLGFFLWAFAASWRRRDPVGFAANVVLLVAVVEVFYYGVMPYGLPVMAIAAAVALRAPDRRAALTSSPAAAGTSGR